MDLEARRCRSTGSSWLSYDDLLGADGVNSVVRQAMATTSEAVDLPGNFKVDLEERMMMMMMMVILELLEILTFIKKLIFFLDLVGLFVKYETFLDE